MGKKRREGRNYTLATRKRVSNITLAKISTINYKDVELLTSFITEKGKIMPGRISGVSTNHQKKIAKAIKLARNIALLSFADETQRAGFEVTNTTSQVESPDKPKDDKVTENAPPVDTQEVSAEPSTTLTESNVEDPDISATDDNQKENKDS